jgi:hypothetical protein
MSLPEFAELQWFTMHYSVCLLFKLLFCLLCLLKQIEEVSIMNELRINALYLAILIFSVVHMKFTEDILDTAYCTCPCAPWDIESLIDMTFSTILLSIVEVAVKSRTVTVKGPRGTLTRTFKHLRLELKLISKSKLKVDVWFASRKELACVRTICSHIQNMFKGVIYVSVEPCQLP